MKTLFWVRDEILVWATCVIAEELEHDRSENWSSESKGPRSAPQDGVRIGVAGQGLDGVADRSTGEALRGEQRPRSKAVWSGRGLGPCPPVLVCVWDALPLG